MLKGKILKRDAITISTMLESELIYYHHYICWADERILLENEPDSWLIEVAASKDSKAASAQLNFYAYSEPFEFFNCVECHDEYVACKLLIHELNGTPWKTFLLECGYYTDGYDAREDCEYFFCMATEFENSNHSINTKNEQHQKIRKRFIDVIEKIYGVYNEFIPYFDKYLVT